MQTETLGPFREEISTSAAAEKYRLTPSYLARLARTQLVRARKIGHDWLLDEDALRVYLAHPRKTGPKALRGTAKEHNDQTERANSDGALAERLIEIRLRFRKEVKKRLFETLWHPSQHIEETPQGYLWTARVSN